MNCLEAQFARQICAAAQIHGQWQYGGLTLEKFQTQILSETNQKVKGTVPVICIAPGVVYYL